jgi:hypothetical protein
VLVPFGQERPRAGFAVAPHQHESAARLLAPDLGVQLTGLDRATGSSVPKGCHVPTSHIVRGAAVGCGSAMGTFYRSGGMLGYCRGGGV